MPVDPRLRDLPALRRRAEELAREAHGAHVSAIWSALYDSYGQALVDALPPMWVYEEAHLALICDLSRPASRDAVARLVAEALGLRAYATAPTLRQHLYMRGARWELGDGDLRCVWHGVPTDHSSHQNYIYAPDIAATGDAAEALTLIAVSVLGGAP